MSKRALDVTISRKSRQEAKFTVEADPRNPIELREVLAGWLASEKWHRGRWGEFEMTVREAGGFKVLTKVRP